jgi:opacity protein-like surface antigen
LASGSADGQHTKNSTTYDLSASTTTLTGGIQWSYDLDINSDHDDDLTPYLGTGISIQNYNYEFEYEGSEVGRTSGTGYGPFVTAGLKITLSSNIVLIPGYHYDQIYIKAEDKTDHTFTSSGFSLALVARF